MPSKQTQLIIILAGVLVAVIAASVVLLWFLPDGTGEVGSDELFGVTSPAPFARSTPAATTSSVAADEFNLRVLQTADYLKLDKQPVVEGALPVTAPATPGKPNPFL